MLTTINLTTRRAAGADAVPRQTTSTGDPAGFASLLRQTQAAPPLPRPVLPTHATPTAKIAADAQTSVNATRNDASGASPVSAAADSAHADNDDEAVETPPTTPRHRTAFKPRPREPEGDTGPREATRARGNRTLPVAEGDTKEADATNPSTALADPSIALTNPAQAPLEPYVMHWFAGQPRATAAPEAPDAATAALSSSPLSEAPKIAPTNAPGEATRPVSEAADLDPKDKPVHARGLADDHMTTAREFSSAMTQPFKSETQTAIAAQAPAPLPAPPTLAFAPVAIPMNAVEAATAAASASIAAPMTSPEFAQELGLTLGVFAKGSVQHAELHLNPDVMGPVSVQIAIDGNHARVDFGADLAATRHAIEQSLPALASALADAGFTLAGGGVSQHAGQSRSGTPSGERDGRDPANPDARFRKTGVEALAGVASAARRLAASGGVDVFA